LEEEDDSIKMRVKKLDYENEMELTLDRFGSCSSGSLILNSGMLNEVEK
jgi:hypothetical protein